MRVPLPFVNTQVAVVGQSSHAVLLSVPTTSIGPSVVQVTNLATASSLQIPLPDCGAPAVVAGSDGCGYLGTTSGRLLCYHPDGTLTDIASSLYGEAFSAGFTSRSGYIYFGTTPGGRVLELAPGGGMRPRIIQPPAAGKHSIHAFVDLPDGRVAAFVCGSSPYTLLITPGDTEVMTNKVPGIAVIHAVPFDNDYLLVGNDTGLYRLAADTLHIVAPVPSLPDGDTLYCLLASNGRVVASGQESGALYYWQDEGWLRLGIPMPGDPLLFTSAPDGRLAGITYHGRLVQSSTDWRMFGLTDAAITMTDRLEISTLGLGPDRKLYLATAGNMRVAAWHPETSQLSPSFVAGPHPGTISAICAIGERLYLGAAHGVMRYYPDLPYRLSENPYYHPWTFGTPRTALLPLGGRLYTITAGEDGQSGCLVRIHPANSAVSAFYDLIPGQRLLSLAVDRLYGSLLIGGEQLAAKAMNPAQLALWSPREERLVMLITPFNFASVVQVWAADGGRVYVTDGGTHYAICSTLDGSVLTHGNFPLGVITALITNAQGELFGLAGGWLFHYEPATECITELAPADGTQLLEVRPGLFAYAHGAQVMTIALGA